MSWQARVRGEQVIRALYGKRCAARARDAQRCVSRCFTLQAAGFASSALRPPLGRGVLNPVRFCVPRLPADGRYGDERMGIWRCSTARDPHYVGPEFIFVERMYLPRATRRSEEHTSELQSQSNLV